MLFNYSLYRLVCYKAIFFIFIYLLLRRMRTTIFSDVLLEKLATALEQIFSGKKGYSSQNVMHITSSRPDKSMGWISAVKEDYSSSLWSYNVLIEQPTVDRSIKFINHGNSFVNEMLAKKFGGCISGHEYWILYNEPLSVFGRYGYEKKLPTAEEIIEYIENLCK